MEFQKIAANLPALLGAVLVAILFLQSGLDKVSDWKGNLEWLTGHFSKTFLKPFVPVMLAKITVIEIAAGTVTALGVVYFLATGSLTVIFWGAVVGALAIVGLFFGQRVAKDYPGAAVLIPYFILLLGLLWLTNPYKT